MDRCLDFISAMVSTFVGSLFVWIKSWGARVEKSPCHGKITKAFWLKHFKLSLKYLCMESLSHESRPVRKIPRSSQAYDRE